MKEFSSLSGPWVGQSIQDGRRITEAIMLTINGNSFHGTGSDADGLFEIEGSLDPDDCMIQIVRRYTRAPMNPSQVGYPFNYIGRWNGEFVEGRWMMSSNPVYGGTFEMWPQGQEEAIETMIQSKTYEMVAPGVWPQ